MQAIIKAVGQARQSGMTAGEIRNASLKKLGLPSKSGLKDQVRAELDRQITLSNRRKRTRRTPPLRTKFDRRSELYDKFTEVARFAGNYIDRDKGDMREVIHWDGNRRMALVGVDDWINYTRDYGTYVKMRGLVLRDRDTGELRFLRVGPTVDSIDEALEYIRPAAVNRAIDEGRDVKRQGDIYLVPQRSWNLKGLPRNHDPYFWRDAGRSGGAVWDRITADDRLNGHAITIIHPHHPPVELTTPHKAYQQIINFNGPFGQGGAGHGD